MRVAIHQPNFMPWMGLFNRLALCDLFVVLDHVQASGGRSWLSRNRLIVSGKARWLTVPIHKSGRSRQRVRDVEINYEGEFVSKHLRTIEYNYKDAPLFNDVFPIIVDMLNRHHRYIVEFNTEFIQWVCTYLHISTPFISSSDLARAESTLDATSANALILEICRTVRATTYTSGTGCTDFIDPESFERAGIAFSFQSFDHPTYAQVGSQEFVSNLSILDALFNVDPEKISRMVRQPGLSSSS